MTKGLLKKNGPQRAARIYSNRHGGGALSCGIGGRGPFDQDEEPTRPEQFPRYPAENATPVERGFIN